MTFQALFVVPLKCLKMTEGCPALRHQYTDLRVHRWTALL